MSSMPSFGDSAERLVTIPGVVPSPEAMPTGCRFAARCPFRIAPCAERPPEIVLGRDHSVTCWRAPLEDEVTAPDAPIAEAGA